MRTALITGANKGIGKQTALELADHGWTVWLGSRDEERGRKAVAEVNGEVGDERARLLLVDVTSDDSVAEALRTVEVAGTGLDVLLNNAGVTGPVKSIEDTVAADFIVPYGTNLLGPVRMTHAFLPMLREADDPRVVMVSSGLGSLTRTNDPTLLESTIHSLVYPSSKAALNMVTTQYARAFTDVTFTIVDPGYTATDLNGHRGTQTVAEGARVVVERATAPAGGPSGTFVSVDGTVPW